MILKIIQKSITNNKQFLTSDIQYDTKSVRIIDSMSCYNLLSVRIILLGYAWESCSYE